MIYLNTASLEFADSGFPGIRVAPVWDENGTGANFIEFKSGAVFPLHDHEGPEQVVMISGRIRFGNLVLATGDFLKIGPGEIHDAEALEDSVFFLDHVGGTIIQQ